MKKSAIFLTVLTLLLLALAGAAATEAANDSLDEWTVMFYFCGSDLESQYGYASGNLEEITRILYPDSFIAVEAEGSGARMTAELTDPGKVNILIETGGSRQWHARELNMDIDASALQRWRYNVYPWGDMSELGPSNGFELLETLPLQSMADPDILADFIRWGAETCPAKKYALVLWGHGDGARSGLFIDELFENDTMDLYVLKQALANSGEHMEALIIDACLMANIETAWSVRNSASWLVASEETVPGKGTAIGDWLQQLLVNPWGDGKWLGRCVCDTTSVKYANEESNASRSLLTWSVIDLSRVDALIDGLEDFFRSVGDALVDYPYLANIYMRSLLNNSAYGDGQQNMRDLGSLIYDPNLVHYIDLGLRSRILNALSEAVDYCVRGPGRSEARGLTFCYPAHFSPAELDVYAKNFPMPRYLSYIDAISDWAAPEWVHESVPRLPEVDSIEALKIHIQRKLSAAGMPGVMVSAPEPNLNSVYYTLYRLDPETNQVLRLGSTLCGFESTEDFANTIWRASDPMHWPAIDGQLICMDMIQYQGNVKLYNVPVMLGSQVSVLRCGRTERGSDIEGESRIDTYDIYGVWEGYDENSLLLDRSVKPLAMLSGQEYRLLYPIRQEDQGGRTLYESGAPLTMFRALDVEEIPVPAGTYYLQYEIEDILMRHATLEPIEIQWDGAHMTFPGGNAWADGVWMDFADLRE